MMILRSIAFLALASMLSADVSVNQWELRQRTSTGMVGHGVTWANGQVIKLDSGVPVAITLDKAAVGLGNVENTELSTWAGTSNVVTVGTVTTGTWNGSVIAPAYLGTGSSIGTKFLRGDGTWQTVDLSAYQATAGTLALAGFGSITGTLAAANGGTGITSLAAGVPTWLGLGTKAGLDTLLGVTLATTGANLFTDHQTIGTGKNFLWQTDAGGDIGTSSSGRPNNIYSYQLTTGGLLSQNSIATGGGASWYWAAGTIMETGGVNGSLKLSNYTRDGWGLLQFGGTTSSFPALKRSGAGLIVRLADDSANGALTAAATTVSSLTVGGGSTVTSVLRATASLNFDLTGVVVEDKTITVTGAAVGDEVAVGVPAASVSTTSQFSAWVSAADTVTVRCRTSVVGEDPASGTFSVLVIQH